MATQVKQYLDFAGLSSYDGLIKEWANSASQLGYKTVNIASDGNNLYFYKKANAVLGTDTPDKTIPLGGGDLADMLDALADIVGATWNSSTEEYDITLDSTFDENTTTVVAALNELKGQINLLNEDDTTAGSVAKAIKDAVEALDGTANIASESNGVVTIKAGITEVDGVISNTGNGLPVAYGPATNIYDVDPTQTQNNLIARIDKTTQRPVYSFFNVNTTVKVTNSSSQYFGKYFNFSPIDTSQQTGNLTESAPPDITLAKVATTGAAVDVSTTDITDGAVTPTTLYAAGTTQGVLTAIARDLNNLTSDAEVTIYSPSSSDYAAVYEFYQGDDGTHAVEKKIGTINIPKDMVVSAGSVVDIVFVEGTGGDPDTLHEGSAAGPDVTEAIKGAGVTPTAADAGKYIKLTIANATLSTLYIPASSLVDEYTGGTTTEITVSVNQSTNVITATVGEVAGTKITYTANETVSAALARLDGDDTTTGSVAKAVKDAIDALDTSSDVSIANYNSSTTAITFQGSLAETNGVIDAGSADAIVISPVDSADISSLFS